MGNSEMTKGMFDFIKQSPTCYHAVKNVTDRLKDAGFQKLCEKEYQKQLCFSIVCGIIKLNIEEVREYENCYIYFGL